MSEQQSGNRSEALEPFEEFVRRHVGPSHEEQEGMLKVLGYESLDALLNAAVPGSVRSLGTLRLPPAVSEQQVLEELRGLAASNTVAAQEESIIRCLAYFECIFIKPAFSSFHHK